MMKKSIGLVLVLTLMLRLTATADEGMWLLTLLGKNYDQMKKQGFRLKPEDIYNVNKASIKDAIIIFGRGCTGEIVSPNGLIFTNHHCGYGAIQALSSVEHDYLKYGFWAKSYDQELPAQGITATFVISIDDVTDKVLSGVTSEMTEEERGNIIRKNSMDIAKPINETNKALNYQASVRSFFEGNAYYLMVYQTYNDVRLVGTPSESIGKFGGDTDNWMWPRHTGDFSIFRVYSAPDGKPADYNEKNIPLKPKHFLPISIKGYKKGDFTMIMGFPGSTDRYLTSAGIKELTEISNTNRIKIRGIRQEIIWEDMMNSDAVRIQYASKYAGSSNYWKNSIGMNRGLKRLKVADKKMETEKQFTAWLAQNDQRKQKYDQTIPLMESAINERGAYMHAFQYLSECITRGTEIISIAARANDLYDVLNGKSTKSKEEVIKALKGNAERFYKDFNAPTDQKVAAAMFKLMYQDVPVQNQPAILDEINKKYNGDFVKFAADMFATSNFASLDKLNKFLENPTKEGLENDWAFKVSLSSMEKAMEMQKALGKSMSDYSKGRRLFMAGLMEMNPQKNYYPDANFTLRLTYGSVGDYSPQDAVTYAYFTTLDGVMQKEDPDNYDFIVDPKLKEVYNKKDFGKWAKNGVLNVCFTSNNDITGGNSGSPIMNGDGHLIGLAFDGNWEAMSGDIAFEPELQKTINVDIRYVLFVIDKLGGAQNIINELKIIE